MPTHRTTTPVDAGDRMLTIADVADRLNVHHSLVRRLINNGALTAIKIGGTYRVRPADLAAWEDTAATTARAAS